MKLRWLPLIAPALIGLGLSLWLNLGPAPNPVLVIRVETSVLIFFLSMGVSLVAGLVMLGIDFLDRSRVNLILTQADDRRRFLRRLDHELKNPLTAILAGLANLRSNDLEGKAQSALTSIESQVHRMRRLVADLRKLAELETRPLETGQVDMTDLVADVYQAASQREGAQDRELALSLPRAPWPLPAVRGDRDLLFLAIYNLIDNAIKFTPLHGAVDVRAYEDGDEVVIEVADTGAGIPEAEREHVWDELYRGESARGVAGSGLGLALVRGIVGRHDGKVSLRSRIGQGTVFSIHLPAESLLKR
jgi:two-component system OmpR family sensor kinase